MQSQIHSYNFPLFDHSENSFISAFKTRHLLLAGVISSTQSLLNLFNYQDENLKKAFSKTRHLLGKIIDLAVNQYNSQHFSSFILQLQGKFSLHKVNQNSFSNEQQAPSEILLTNSLRFHSHALNRDNSCIYLSSDKSIEIFDTLKSTLAGKISHNFQKTSLLSIDPTFQMPTLVTQENSLIFFDKKSLAQKYTIKASASVDIINYDFNPNKQYNLMTCHHQSIKFWDLRKGNIPFKTYLDHHNLLTQAKYNHSHDQLIACAYDDGSVGLLRLVSASSSIQDSTQDALVKLYDEHQDSVMKVQWTRCSPWIFASIAYNASQLVLNIVPSAQKYRILL